MTSPESDTTLAELSALTQLASDYFATRRDSVVTPQLDDAAIAQRLARYDFVAPQSLEQVATDIFDLLGRGTVRTDSPRYFGLFNPPSLPAAVAGDLIAAVVNPQLAVCSHAPAAAEIEKKLIRLFGSSIGWEDSAGVFTSGGAEANHTACIAALARRYPGWANRGLAAAHPKPTMFVSAEAHLAWVKIARSVGLGAEAVRLVPTRNGLELCGDALAQAVAAEPDRDPFLIAATAGTTAHGAIDAIADLSEIAQAYEAYLHVDAAWAGAALLLPEFRNLFRGIHKADSVTIDPHKWLCVPMGAGMFLAPGWKDLETAFSVSTSYMPSASIERRDAYVHSMQWSRRFIGLKVFMALTTSGLASVCRRIRHQIEIGAQLRRALAADGWQVLNDTPLPLVCFVPAGDGNADDSIRAIERSVVASGRAWISSVRLRGHLVCVTSHESTGADVDVLLHCLREATRA